MTAEEQQAIAELLHSHTTPVRLVERAHIVQAAADGRSASRHRRGAGLLPPKEAGRTRKKLQALVLALALPLAAGCTAGS